MFGFAVDGCVLSPELAGFVGFEPGALDGEPGAVAPVGGGAVELVGGGVVVLVGGVAAPGARLCLAPELPAGALCATTQVAQKRSAERNASFLADIGSPLFKF